MKVRDYKIDDLIPYENNPRDNDNAVGAVAASIKEFGFKVPIIIDRDNVIVCGHTRLKAARVLGLASVPCILADDLTPDQIKAFRLADNKSAELATWDIEKMVAELKDISEIDMSEFGFDVSVFQDDQVDDEMIDDDFDDTDVETKTVIGDVWVLGDHRLICGDATDPNVVEKCLDGERAALVLTDPPYGIKAVERGGHNDGKQAGHQMCRDNVYKPVINDDTTDTARDFYNLAVSYSDNQMIFGGNYFTDFLPPSRCWVVWDKQVAGSFADGELCWTSFDKNLKIYSFMWSGMRREGDRAAEGVKRVHPTQKPVGLLSRILNDYSDQNDIIFDGFGGSGSLMIACEDTGRRCRMIELDPYYCDVIVARWEKFTGKKAVRNG